MNTITVGDIEIKKFQIINWNGKNIQYDWTGLMTGMSLYEDIFSPTLMLDLDIMDTHNLISEYPLIGEETLLFDFVTPHQKEEIKLKMRCVKISNRQITGNKQTYTMQFVSEEYYKDNMTRLSKAFTGSADSIIKTIMKEYVKSEKLMTFDTPGNLLKVVSPFWSPFKLISWLTSKSLSTDKFNESTFLFYENNKGYEFKPLYKLLEQAPVMEYKYVHESPVSRSDSGQLDDIDLQYAKINRLNFFDVFDLFTKYGNGGMSKLTYSHDILFKSVDKITFHDKDDFAKTKHLGGNATYSTKLEIPKYSRYDNKTIFPFMFNEISNDYGSFIQNRRISKLSQMEFMKLNIEVYGHTKVKVGDVIDLRFGKYTSDRKDENFDDFYDGKYLIVAIHHQIAAKQHKMTMQIIRESVKESYDMKKELIHVDAKDEERDG